MNLWTKFLIWIGAVEKTYSHVMSPITKMTEELEDLAARKREQILNSEEAVRLHEANIALATAAKEEANAGAAAVRALFLPKAA